jgi:hypothetical protein
MSMKSMKNDKIQVKKLFAPYEFAVICMLIAKNNIIIIDNLLISLHFITEASFNNKILHFFEIKEFLNFK